MDTRDKRASVLGLGLASLLVLPSPGTLDQGDRQQTTFCYRGILAAAAIVIEGDIITTASSYFGRAVTGQSGVFGRGVTTAVSAFGRTVTTEDTER